MAKKQQDKELIPADETPQWIVTSSEPDAQHRQTHRLFYGKKRQAIGKTPGDLRRFRELAEFCNRQRLAPREKVQCLADENLPAPPRRKSTDAPEPEAAEPADA